MKLNTYIPFVLLFILSFIIRVWFLPVGALTFGYDQARDAVLSRQIAQGDFKILGPSSSTPGLYHGVLYYYVLAPIYGFTQNPIAAAYWMAFLNSLTVFVVAYFAYLFTKNKWAGIAAGLFYAFSYEASQYATWLSNPTLGMVTVPLFYLGLWLWTHVDKKGNRILPIVLTAVSLGFSIQAEIFLAYHIVPLLIFLVVYRKNLHRKDFLIFFIAFVASLSTMILSEVKFGFKGVSGVSSLLSTGDAIVAGHGLGDFFVLFLNQIGRVYSAASYPGNVGYGTFLVVLPLIYFLNGTKEKAQSWVTFLAVWLFSHASVVTVGGTSTPFLLVGISPAVSILLGILCYTLFKNSKLVGLFLIFFIVVFQVKTIVKENARGSAYFAIQKDLVISKETAAVDYMYSKANGEPFTVNSLTSPLWVNIVWAYLFNWYGQEHYQYQPSWTGRGQEGQVIALQATNKPMKHHFLILEPMAGIPFQYLPDIISQEDSITRLVEEKTFGEIRIQYREPITK